MLNDKSTETRSEISDELIEDIAIFTEPYVAEIRAAVIKNIRAIARDATLTKLLREHATRKQTEADEYRKNLKYVVEYDHDYQHHNNVLTHSSSYRDVIYDLLKHYWTEEKKA